jgi:hypothetical protein
MYLQSKFQDGDEHRMIKQPTKVGESAEGLNLLEKVKKYRQTLICTEIVKLEGNIVDAATKAAEPLWLFNDMIAIAEALADSRTAAFAVYLNRRVFLQPLKAFLAILNPFIE